MTKDKPTMMPPPPTITFINDPMAPDVFADEAVGFFCHAGVIRITLAAGRVDHASLPGPVNRVVIGRLVMSVEGAQRLAIGLFDFLKSHGLTLPIATSGEPVKPN